jgi:hypothetical protein
MPIVGLRIIGRRLPGATWSGREQIHVGVQRGNEVVGLVPGDAGDAVIDIDLELIECSDGSPDFRGPYVNGRRGERFVYLSWGELDSNGEFAMFRRAKLHLAPLADQHPAANVAGCKRIQAILDLTDAWGRPISASVRPPWVTWRLEPAARTA